MSASRLRSRGAPTPSTRSGRPWEPQPRPQPASPSLHTDPRAATQAAWPAAGLPELLLLRSAAPGHRVPGDCSRHPRTRHHGPPHRVARGSSLRTRAARPRLGQRRLPPLSLLPASRRARRQLPTLSDLGGPAASAGFPPSFCVSSGLPRDVPN